MWYWAKLFNHAMDSQQDGRNHMVAVQSQIPALLLTRHRVFGDAVQPPHLRGIVLAASLDACRIRCVSPVKLRAGGPRVPTLCWVCRLPSQQHHLSRQRTRDCGHPAGRSVAPIPQAINRQAEGPCMCGSAAVDA